LFNYLGTEMVAISSGEARSAGEIPRATYISFSLLTFVYLFASTVLVGVVPWNRVGTSESPFVTVFEVARVPAISHIMNFVALTAALSGSNASLYVTSRMLYSLAESGFAPAKLTKLTSTGSPRWAVLVSASGIFVALLVQYVAPQNAYLYIIGASLFGGLLAWCIALASHIAMRKRLSSQQIAALPMRAPGGAVASLIALAAITSIVISTWWVPQSRITIVSAGPYLLFLTVFYVLMKKNKAANRMTP
jgi:L-asparagine transporter-like permease